MLYMEQQEDSLNPHTSGKHIGDLRFSSSRGHTSQVKCVALLVYYLHRLHSGVYCSDIIYQIAYICELSAGGYILAWCSSNVVQ